MASEAARLREMVQVREEEIERLREALSVTGEMASPHDPTGLSEAASQNDWEKVYEIVDSWRAFLSSSYCGGDANA